jgi:hypothetical protein
MQQGRRRSISTKSAPSSDHDWSSSWRDHWAHWNWLHTVTEFERHRYLSNTFIR